MHYSYYVPTAFNVQCYGIVHVCRIEMCLIFCVQWQISVWHSKRSASHRKRLRINTFRWHTHTPILRRYMHCWFAVWLAMAVDDEFWRWFCFMARRIGPFSDNGLWLICGPCKTSFGKIHSESIDYRPFELRCVKRPRGLKPIKKSGVYATDIILCI